MEQTISITITLPSSDNRLHQLENHLNTEGISFQKTHDKPNKFNLNDLGKKGQIVLELMSEGYSYTQIAKELGITIDGVRYYVKKIYKVLGVNKVSSAVRIYVSSMN